MNDRDVVRASLSEIISMLMASQVTRGIHTDCLLNYETVKYFNGEQHESERYADAIRQYQAVEYKVLGTSLPQHGLGTMMLTECTVSLNILNLAQNFIIVSHTSTLQT